MHPTLITVAGYGLPSYGVLAALGILAAVGMALRLGRREGLDADFLLDAVFWAVVAGFAGARMAYLAVTWRETVRAPLASLFSGGGGVYLAGLAAGLGTVLLLCRRKGVPFAAAADVFAPALALGHAFGRVGCHLAGCCWGCRLEGAGARWGVRYPRLLSEKGMVEGSWPWLDHLGRGWISAREAWSRPVAPVQLLEAGFDLLLVAGLLVLWKFRRFRGQIALAYGGAYAVIRFGLEFLRGDAARGLYGPFSFSQWLCLAALGGGVAIVWRGSRRETA